MKRKASTSVAQGTKKICRPVRQTCSARSAKAPSATSTASCGENSKNCDAVNSLRNRGVVSAAGGTIHHSSSIRAIKAKKSASEQEPRKRKKTTVSPKNVIHPSYRRTSGVLAAVGTGDTGQLGLGEDVWEASAPRQVNMEDLTFQACAGGMHSLSLTLKGEVYSWGCNDEGALGRDTKCENDCFSPGQVFLPGNKIVQVSAGDSHSAALSTTGQVFIWGTFRDSQGVIGLLDNCRVSKTPIWILQHETVVKISSGSDHLLMLTDGGDVYSMGNGQQGQLGRVAECFSERGGRKGLGFFLTPHKITFRSRGAIKFSDVWAIPYGGFCKVKQSGKIWAWGLNNHYQLGIEEESLNCYTPFHIKSFKGRNWVEIVGGPHHTIALDDKGKVYALGRPEYGRLGLGELKTPTDADHPEEEVQTPTCVMKLSKERCIGISSAGNVSYAVMESGAIYSWGMGSTNQLSQKTESDVWEPGKMLGKTFQGRRGLQVSAGGQHTLVLLATID